MQLEWADAVAQENVDVNRKTTFQGSFAMSDVEALEQKLCAYTGAAHCVSVESATTGMLLALKAAGIDSGDIVLCTSFSYFALPEIIQIAGATPMLVDINPNTFNMDPYFLEYMIGKCIRNRSPLPKALIAVDLFGLPCDYEALEEICARYGIYLIEDMAQSFGASFRDRPTGNFGRMAVASFFSTKPVDEMGEGGVVFCHTLQDARRLESLRSKIGMRSRANALFGGGGYLDTVQASIVSEKLELFDFELECRRELAARYRERLEGVVKIQQEGKAFKSAYTQFVISLANTDTRSLMMECLRDAHIPCQIYDPSPLCRRGVWYESDKADLINTKAVSQRILALPVHPYLSRRVVDYVCDKLIQAIAEIDEEPECFSEVEDLSM